MRRRNLAPMLLALTVITAACGGSDYTTTPDGGGGGGGGGGGNPNEVVISNYRFTAPEVTIDRGQTVTWRNGTSTLHTVTPVGHTAFAERQTNTAGQIFETRFETAGRYEYDCAVHRDLGMRGVVIVR